MIKIFDSNSHFLQSQSLNSKYYSQIKKNNISGSAVTLLPDKSLDELLKNYDNSPNFYPIPYFNGHNLNNLKKLHEIYKFKGIKIHPRFSNLKLSDLNIYTDLFNFAIENNLFIFICTYYHTITNYPTEDPIFSISKMKNIFPNLKLILLHGGDVRLAEFAQFTRHFDDVYIDLSYTLTKYNSDYIDSQILFCFNELDEKCLIGSDFPYVSLDLFRKRVDLLTTNISNDKKCNIYYKNAEKIFS